MARYPEMVGKVVLVTGGSSGIGLASAQAFADQGATVVVASRDEKRAQEALKTFPAGAKVSWIGCDASDGKSVEGPYHFYFKQLVRKLVGFGNRGNLFKTDQSMPDAAITPEYVTDKLVLAGTVNSVVDQILAFREQVGDFGTLVYACHDWMDAKLGRRSMELMAEKVMPAVNAAIRR